MRRFLMVVAASALLSQCSAPPATTGPVATPLTLQAIAGQWDIVSFEGHRPARLDSDGQRHAFVDIRGSDLSFAIECNYSGMSARLDGDRLVATSNDNMQTEMGCGPEREGRDAAFFALLRGGPTVSQPSANALLTGAISAENIPPSRLYIAAGDVYAVLRRA